MKKILGITALVIIIGVGSLVAYADTPIVTPRNWNTGAETREDFLNRRQEYMKEEIKRALERGEITEEEAKEWEEHIEYMDEFYNKNNFSDRFDEYGMYGMHGYGGCGRGRGMGMMRGMGNRGMNMMRGGGRGMMRGFSL